MNTHKEPKFKVGDRVTVKANVYNPAIEGVVLSSTYSSSVERSGYMYRLEDTPYVEFDEKLLAPLEPKEEVKTVMKGTPFESVDPDSYDWKGRSHKIDRVMPEPTPPSQIEEVPEFDIDFEQYNGLLVGEAAREIINELIKHYNKHIVEAINKLTKEK